MNQVLISISLVDQDRDIVSDSTLYQAVIPVVGTGGVDQATIDQFVKSSVNAVKQEAIKHVK